jgi:hypothetical protein
VRHAVTFKRMEFDVEYRARLLAHPRVYGLLYTNTKSFGGASLDAIGDFVDCPRRIVEDTRP